MANRARKSFPFSATFPLFASLAKSSSSGSGRRSAAMGAAGELSGHRHHRRRHRDEDGGDGERSHRHRHRSSSHHHRDRDGERGDDASKDRGHHHSSRRHRHKSSSGGSHGHRRHRNHTPEKDAAVPDPAPATATAASKAAAAANPIAKDDYFRLNPEFCVWLVEAKGMYFSELTSDSVRPSLFILLRHTHKPPKWKVTDRPSLCLSLFRRRRGSTSTLSCRPGTLARFP